MEATAAGVTDPVMGAAETVNATGGLTRAGCGRFSEPPLDGKLLDANLTTLLGLLASEVMLSPLVEAQLVGLGWVLASELTPEVGGDQLLVMLRIDCDSFKASCC